MNTPNERAESFIGRGDVGPNGMKLAWWDFADAGFFAKDKDGNSDVVQCWVCGIRIGFWEAASDPLLEHYRLNKKCVYALNKLARRCEKEQQRLQKSEAKKKEKQMRAEEAGAAAALDTDA